MNIPPESESFLLHPSKLLDPLLEGRRNQESRVFGMMMMMMMTITQDWDGSILLLTFRRTRGGGACLWMKLITSSWGLVDLIKTVSSCFVTSTREELVRRPCLVRNPSNLSFKKRRISPKLLQHMKWRRTTNHLSHQFASRSYMDRLGKLVLPWHGKNATKAWHDYNEEGSNCSSRLL